MPSAHSRLGNHPSTFAARCQQVAASKPVSGFTSPPDAIPQERGEIQNSLLSLAWPSSLSCPGRAELGKQMGLTMPRGSVALGPDGAASFELNDPSARGAAPSSSRLLTRCIAQAEAWQSVDLSLWFTLQISGETAARGPALTAKSGRTSPAQELPPYRPHRVLGRRWEQDRDVLRHALPRFGRGVPQWRARRSQACHRLSSST